MSDYLIEVQNLHKTYRPPVRFLEPERPTVYAVNGVSWSLKRGTTTGLVGESGCGKSTIARLLMQLEQPTSGQIRYNGRNIAQLSPTAEQEFRTKAQMIFQDPNSALNPRMTIGQSITEPLRVCTTAGKPEIAAKSAAMLTKVGLPGGLLSHFPHELSGGQKQRVCIARALILEPEFIVADEPLSALDVSIGAQVLNLFCDLQQELGLTYLFISHDLQVVRFIADRVIVMYLGRVMEIASTSALFASPQHPYTMLLLGSIPTIRPGARKVRRRLSGDVPNPINLPGGCVFHTRCPQALPRCSQEIPQLVELTPEHFAACFLAAAK